MHDDDSSHFKNKLINVGNGRFNDAIHGKSRYKPTLVPILQKDQVVQIVGQMYCVESETDADRLKQFPLDGICAETREANIFRESVGGKRRDDYIEYYTK